MGQGRPVGDARFVTTGGYSPYELVTGMKPIKFLDDFWRRVPLESHSPRRYADVLQQMMLPARAQVQRSIHAGDVRRMKARAGDPPRTGSSVGDSVSFRSPPRPLMDRKDGSVDATAQGADSAMLLPSAASRCFVGAKQPGVH